MEKYGGIANREKGWFSGIAWRAARGHRRHRVDRYMERFVWVVAAIIPPTSINCQSECAVYKPIYKFGSIVHS